MLESKDTLSGHTIRKEHPINLLFDTSIRAVDQQQQEPYQPRWWCTCQSS